VNSMVSHEVDELRKLRDELKVQAHLGKLEAKEAWDKLEDKWLELEGRLKNFGKESSESIKEVGEATTLLLSEIRDGYKRIKGAL